VALPPCPEVAKMVADSRHRLSSSRRSSRSRRLRPSSPSSAPPVRSEFQRLAVVGTPDRSGAGAAPGRCARRASLCPRRSRDRSRTRGIRRGGTGQSRRNLPDALEPHDRGAAVQSHRLGGIEQHAPEPCARCRRHRHRVQRRAPCARGTGRARSRAARRRAPRPGSSRSLERKRSCRDRRSCSKQRVSSTSSRSRSSACAGRIAGSRRRTGGCALA
jgi:hypothetical protein